MPVIIRHAVGADAPPLTELVAQHADYERSRALPDAHALAAALDAVPPRLWVWIAEEGGSLVGYAAVTEDFSTWRAQPYLHLDCLFVRAGYRGRGIGADLFRQHDVTPRSMASRLSNGRLRLGTKAPSVSMNAWVAPIPRRRGSA